MISLETRLHLGLALALTAVIGSAWWIGHIALHHSSESVIYSRLEHDAEGLLGSLRSGHGHLHVAARHLTPVYNQPLSGHYFVVEDDQGNRLRSRSLWDEDLDTRALAPGETAAWRAAGPDRQSLLVWAGGYRLDAHLLTLTIAEDVSEFDTEIDFFERLFALLAVCGLALSLVLQRLIVQRAFTSLRPLYRDIERLEHGRAGTLTEQVPPEILPLVRKFNRLLERFGQRLERSRTAAGNLAHALKGPLTLLRQQLAADTLALDAEQRQGLLDQVERLRQIAERQLKRARLAGAGGAALYFEPEEELPVLARLLKRMHAPKQLHIAFDSAIRGPLAVDREDMLELLGNLLDNACKWAEGEVRATLSVNDGELLIRVDDDGPGCAEAALSTLTERGLRLDEQVSGHGLGLAIVREIVEGYGGQLTLTHAPLGGLRAEARLTLEHATSDRAPRSA
ncbi:MULTISPECIES: sensor histidine kinase [unclassified Marichromatium]|uniref:ATP-binding protein n=1 Tax=unclassified Marichromatium TaxID=2618417 RepID=UPI000F3E7A15|nr:MULTISPECIES: sensor histidine kinase [unclassified Marichromatium]MBO8087110.1 sensor histidine kinase [Marichromatium sp.]RNE91926.1 sensor histidine kinase [Marichromatium sp. AB31]RNE92320.1 sensor histidine kinase [Marichromatium sp. AB32]